ncbi:MAG TPA: dienelactone hydrolase family protein [Polyangiaceae bacterium]|nr:dienelactone hydrolase family protein [Polyangiaceae bacterium]
MSLKTEWVPYGSGGEYAGYLAYPANAPKPLPGVLIVQEAWGVDAHIEAVTRRFARAGRRVRAGSLREAGAAPRGPALRLVATSGGSLNVESSQFHHVVH